MHPEIASALVDERQRDLARRASQLRAPRGVSEYTGTTGSRAPDVRGWRVPRYRVSWSRMTVPAIAGTGRHGRSWVIVISASKGL